MSERKFGICMEGLEDQFEDVVRNAVPKFPFVIYVEIGVAYGQTVTEVSKILKECCDGKYISMAVDPAPIEDSIEKNYGTSWKGLRIALFRMTSENFFDDLTVKILLEFGLSLAFIDGCHSVQCVKSDFERVEKHCVTGSVVILHDFNENAQGGDPQPHCNGAPIGVRQACQDLGLLDGTRPNWKRLPDMIGDRSRGGADCAVFERL